MKVCSRQLDKLGRIVIPIQVRRKEGLNYHVKVNVYVGENGEIILKKSDDKSEIALTQTLDCLGRFVIPITIRRELDLKKGTLLDIIWEDTGIIIIKKSYVHCAICGEIDNSNTIIIKEKHICNNCIKDIRKLSKDNN